MAELTTLSSLVGLSSNFVRDFRWPGIASGCVRDRVMIKLTPSSPESPFKNGRIWLFRAIDGYRAWEGYSDDQGWYTARGLEIGEKYHAVAIDPYEEHKTTAAGPVVAVREDQL
ncbi:hypothetical protein [Diaphorobacter caeni]|uniref:hypothetical protein n=1 Tax=Diaphorobacter caeni TaxID=2784387 RepID=UPI00188F3E28|nr:hypothetical protein [Diaphorobacter caeni]MBF5006354.1 hypothetical protein [Diaphorobacter caeni]